VVAAACWLFPAGCSNHRFLLAAG